MICRRLGGRQRATELRLMRLGRIEDRRERLHSELEPAASLGARAVVLEPPAVARDDLAPGDRYPGCEILWSNARYALIRLVDDSLRGAPEPDAG